MRDLLAVLAMLAGFFAGFLVIYSLDGPGWACVIGGWVLGGLWYVMAKLAGER